MDAHRNRNQAVSPINRRQALAALGLAAAIPATRLGAFQNRAARPVFSSFDHIEFTVSNIERSRDFYVRLFGGRLTKNNNVPKRYLQLGTAFLAIQPEEDILLQHFCAGITDFSIDRLHAYLKQENIEYRDFPSGADLSVLDPDGIRMQIAADNVFEDLPASPEQVSLTGPAVFQPTGLDHILLNVTDLAASAAYYQPIFGNPQREDGRVWFQAGRSRVGLVQAAAGTEPGVHHFCVAANRFDYEPAMQQLRAAGAMIEAAETTGSPMFRDPDGWRVQVIAR